MTAVVLNHNGRHLLEVILPSLAAQTYEPLDIVVVDDASSDDSLVYLAGTWPQVRVVALEHNVGIAAAMNRGMSAATGELIALLNNDLELEPDWAEHMAAAMLANPSAASAACKLRRYHERERLDSAGDAILRSMRAHARGAGELDRGQYDEECDVLSATGGAALYRSSAIAAVGPFDEGFGAYLEDVDWGLRARLAGMSCRYVPQAVGYHMGNATTGGSANPRVLGQLVRNGIGLMVKDIPLRLLAANAPAILREQAGTIVHNARAGHLRVHLRALAQAAAMTPGWLAARRRIQRSRGASPADLAPLLTDRGA